MNQRQANDLATLYYYLKDTPEHEIDMEYVFRGDEDDFLYEGGCNTAGCVVGHMAIAFPGQFDVKTIRSDYGLNKIVVNRERSSKGFAPLEYDETFARFFGVLLHEADYVTNPTRYSRDYTKEDILKRLRDLADSYGYDIAWYDKE